MFLNKLIYGKPNTAIQLYHLSNITFLLITTYTHHYPAPLKLRPYGAIQICLLLLLL